jgi:prepilin signal peptidase PulO-like enzyme (type II secretory pathway)
LYAFLFVLLSVIFLYDLRHKIVPLSFSLLLLIVGIAFEVWKVMHLQSFYNSSHSTLFYLDLFSGILIALPFFLVNIFSKGRGVGMGDVILFLGVGYLLGFVYGISTFLLSVWIGALISLFLIYFLPKKFNKKSAIPFAPFIVAATIIVLFLHIDILGISIFLQ